MPTILWRDYPSRQLKRSPAPERRMKFKLNPDEVSKFIKDFGLNINNDPEYLYDESRRQIEVEYTITEFAKPEFASNEIFQ